MFEKHSIVADLSDNYYKVIQWLKYFMKKMSTAQQVWGNTSEKPVLVSWCM